MRIRSVVCAVCVVFLYGCAGLGYNWRETRAPAPKPWKYVYVNDVDAYCKSLNVHVSGFGAVQGCANYWYGGCTIYLPKNPERWVVEHEEKHCAGWEHG